MVLKLIYTFAQSKVYQMKKILLGFIAIGLLTFVGCDKDDDTDIDITDNQSVNNNQTNSNTLGDDVSSEADTKSDGDTTDTLNITSSIKYGDGVTDVDGNTYQSVIIGEQEWMAENLKTTKFANGTLIPNVTDDDEWKAMTSGAWCHYDNDSDNDMAYGKLYNWYSVETEELCLAGWHVPTDAEWTILGDYLIANGHDGSEGIALKSTSGWDDYNGEIGIGTDDYGWNGLTGGYRYSFSFFQGIGFLGMWWSSTESNEYFSLSRELGNYITNLKHDYNDKVDGLSVRCLRD